MNHRFWNAGLAAGLSNCAVCSPSIGGRGQRWSIKYIVPSCTICAALARSGVRPTRVCAKRDRASWPTE
jgi:hypothetical protein